MLPPALVLPATHDHEAWWSGKQGGRVQARRQAAPHSLQEFWCRGRCIALATTAAPLQVGHDLPGLQRPTRLQQLGADGVTWGGAQDRGQGGGMNQKLGIVSLCQCHWCSATDRTGHGGCSGSRTGQREEEQWRCWAAHFLPPLPPRPTSLATHTHTRPPVNLELIPDADGGRQPSSARTTCSHA